MTEIILRPYKKKGDFNYDRSIYIVGDPQIQHFKWLFAILDMLGFKEDNYHLHYGMISLPSGKMKSREGNVVDADDLIDEMIELAKKEILKREPKIKQKELVKRSEKIGLGAIKFHILKSNKFPGFQKSNSIIEHIKEIRIVYEI